MKVIFTLFLILGLNQFSYAQEPVGNFDGAYQGPVTITSNGIQKRGNLDMYLIHQVQRNRIDSGNIMIRIGNRTTAISIPTLLIQGNDVLYQSQKIGVIGLHDLEIDGIFGHIKYHQECKTAHISILDTTSDPPIQVEGDLQRYASEQGVCH